MVNYSFYKNENEKKGIIVYASKPSSCMKSSGRSRVMSHSCLIFFHAQWLEKQPIFCVFHAEHGKAGESLCKIF